MPTAYGAAPAHVEKRPSRPGKGDDVETTKGGARPGAGRKPGLSVPVAAGIEDALCLLEMAAQRLVLVRSQPLAQPSYAELRQLAVARTRKQLDTLPPAA